MDKTESEWNRKPVESLLAAMLRETAAQTRGETTREVPDRIKVESPGLDKEGEERAWAWEMEAALGQHPREVSAPQHMSL